MVIHFFTSWKRLPKTMSLSSADMDQLIKKMTSESFTSKLDVNEIDDLTDNW